MLSCQEHYCLFNNNNISFSSISFFFLLYQTIHQIFSISHPFLSSQTLSYLFLSFQLLFRTKHTVSESDVAKNLNNLHRRHVSIEAEEEMGRDRHRRWS